MGGRGHAHGGGDQRGDLGHVGRNHESRCRVAGQARVGLHGFFRDLELHGVAAAGLADGLGDAFYGFRGGRRNGFNGSCFRLRFVDNGLFFALGSGDGGFALAGCDVDLFLPAAF